ncbi:MAG: hypothetical protein AAF587_33365 [Bacteroidota bacterium]
MKHLLTLLFILSVGTFHLSAQAFEEGQLSVSPGIMLGGLGVYGGGVGFPLGASAGYAFHEMFDAGPFIGIARYTYGPVGSQYRWNFVSFGARGDFHYLPLLEEFLEVDLSSEELDLYVGVLAGFQIAGFSSNDVVLGPTLNFSNRATYGLAVGGRYYFADNLAAFAEIGFVLYGILNAGLTFRIY